MRAGAHSGKGGTFATPGLDREKFRRPPESFPKEHSLALKGVAILMMLWLHCSWDELFKGHTVSFWPLTQNQVSNIALFCKICVSLFAFVSGYGLYLSWQKREKNGQSASRWVYDRLVRTLSGYWFVVIVAWVVCTLLDNRPYQAYGFARSTLLGLWNMLVEFLGLANLTGGRLLNGAWWYMSAAVVFIVLLPLLYEGLQRLGCFCTLAVILIFPRISMGFPGDKHFFSFLPIFCVGMIFARYDVFALWTRLWRDRPVWIRILKFLFMLVGLLAVYKLFYCLDTKSWWDIKWNFLPLAVIFFARDYLFQIPGLNHALIFVGKHATNIFLVHIFILYTYCKAFLYECRHYILVVGTLFLISLGISIILEWLKKAVRYEKLIGVLLRAPDALCPKAETRDL